MVEGKQVDPDDPRRGVPAGRRRSPRRWVTWIVLAVVAIAAAGFAAILVYANFINDPADELTADDLRERLSEPTTTTGTTTTAGRGGQDDPANTDALDPDATPEVDGAWRATSASELGYRVTEVLFGVNTEGVGRTNDVTGSLVIDGTTVTSAEFTVEMATVESDDSRRDGQFRGRIMSVAEHPTATFVLTEPIELGEIPPPGEQISATATGDLTLRGVTNTVTFEVAAQLQDERIGVLGNIPVVFADYDIVNPSIAGITTEDDGLLEFVLVFER